MAHSRIKATGQKHRGGGLRSATEWNSGRPRSATTGKPHGGVACILRAILVPSWHAAGRWMWGGKGRMTERIETDVAIIGGGPVGLTLAMDLAGRGVRVTVLEQRAAGEPPSVKCNHVAARSMELYRRLGVARKLRDAGLPPDYPNDAAWRTTMTGREIARIPIPCRRDRYTATDGPDTWWPTPEPPHRINQIYLEPILFAHAEAVPGVTILNRVCFEGLTLDDDGVTARARMLDSGETLTLSARYLIGCDGARSEVRRAIGARLTGDPVVQRVQSTYIR